MTKDINKRQKIPKDIKKTKDPKRHSKDKRSQRTFTKRQKTFTKQKTLTCTDVEEVRAERAGELLDGEELLDRVPQQLGHEGRDGAPHYPHEYVKGKEGNHITSHGPALQLRNRVQDGRKEHSKKKNNKE